MDLSSCQKCPNQLKSEFWEMRGEVTCWSLQKSQTMLKEQGYCKSKVKGYYGLWLHNTQATGLKGIGHLNCQQMKNHKKAGCHSPAFFFCSHPERMCRPQARKRAFSGIPGHGEQQDFHWFSPAPQTLLQQSAAKECAAPRKKD